MNHDHGESTDGTSSMEMARSYRQRLAQSGKYGPCPFCLRDGVTSPARQPTPHSTRANWLVVRFNCPSHSINIPPLGGDDNTTIRTSQYSSPSAIAVEQPSCAEATTRPALRPWQAEALAMWERAHHRGVVQAVTGTGKTRVGLEAAERELSSGGNVLILVPTRALLQQWYRQLTLWFGAAAVGRFGDGFHESFCTHRLLVATPHSARKGTRFRGSGLLVADECHRYGSKTWSDALDERFLRRLGLTATYERQDDGDARLAGFFGGAPVFDIDYRRAIDENVVSPFRLAFVGVDLGEQEMIEYRAYDEACKSARAKLCGEFHLPDQPFAGFMREVARAADGLFGRKAQVAAWSYQSNFAKRRALLADTSEKLRCLEVLEPIVASAHGTLIFTQTRQAAQTAAMLFAEKGHRASAIWGELERDEREHLLDAFKKGDQTVLAAPRVLDEGIDVPDADLGIVVSASSGRRQMIQRMGRILRHKPDGHAARLVILYARGTSEDPEDGAHEAFIEIAWDVAEARQIFGPEDSPRAIEAFLRFGENVPSVTSVSVLKSADLGHRFSARGICVRCGCSENAIHALGWNCSPADASANPGPSHWSDDPTLKVAISLLLARETELTPSLATELRAILLPAINTYRMHQSDYLESLAKCERAYRRLERLAPSGRSYDAD